MNARKTKMRAEIEQLVVDLTPLMNAAADQADFHQMQQLRERRAALELLLSNIKTDD